MSNLGDKESFLDRLTEFINANITNAQFGVNELAREIGMSRSNLHRKVISYTGSSVSKFICRVRLEKAKYLLNESTSNISEIAFKTGFHSVTYFTKCFKDRYGYPPGEARKHMYNEGNQEDIKKHKENQGIAKKRISILYFFGTILLLIVAVVLIFWRPFSGVNESEDILIAVLPFINDSPEESGMHIINGTMEAIINNLNKIENLRVTSRTSVEQYRNHPQPIPVIGKELGVDYILEGSGQVYGKRMHLTVQLLDAKKDKHIWSEEYNLEISQIENLFNLQNKIAMMVVTEIHAEVSPEEMRRMKKIPTKSNVAYEFYLKGFEEVLRFWTGDRSSDSLSYAELLIRSALEYDPAYAAAYRQIGYIYYLRSRSAPSNIEYMDSMKINLDRALSCDPEDAASYQLLGSYYRTKGNWDKAIENLNQALKYDPKSQNIYVYIGDLYTQKNDFVNALEYLNKSLSSSEPEKSHTNVTELLMRIFLMAGCKAEYNHFADFKLKYTGDTAGSYCDRAIAEYWIDSNIQEALELLEKSYQMDSTNLETLNSLGEVCLYDGQYARSLEYYEKSLARLNGLDQVYSYHTPNIGLVYWLNGDKENAEHYFDLQISYCTNARSGIPDSHYQLAAIYAIKGDHDLAYRHLHEFNRQDRMNIYVKNGFKENNPFFASIQNETEYKSIRAEVLAKYQAEHERVRQWLEVNDML